MTRLEVMGILFALVVCVGLFAWVFWSNLIAREKVPVRLIYSESHVQLYNAPGRLMPVYDGDPQAWIVPAVSMRTFTRFAWPWEVTDEELPDFDFPTTPPAPRLFDQFNPRPWAHG